MTGSSRDSAALRNKAEALRSEAVGHLEKGQFAASLERYDAALGSARETNDDSFVDWIFACRAAAAAERRGRRRRARRAQADSSPRAREPDGLPGRLHRRPHLRAEAGLQEGRLLRAPRATARRPDRRSSSPRQRREHAGNAPCRGQPVRRSRRMLPARPRHLFPAGPCSRSCPRTLAGQPRVPPHRPRPVLGGTSLVHEALETIERSGATAHTVFPLMDLCFGYLKGDRYEEARYFGEVCLERGSRSPETTVSRGTCSTCLAKRAT